MNLEKIIAIAGKSGLYEIQGSTKSGYVVKSLENGTKTVTYITDKISLLSDIKIFIEDGEIDLSDVFMKIYEKEEKQSCTLNLKSSNEEIKTYFGEVLPDFDEEKVHASDIKKVVKWYNLLFKNDFFEAEAEEESKTEAGETNE